MDVLLQMLTVLFRCGHTSQAFDIICTLFQTSGLTLPQEFYSGIKTDLDKHKFVGEFLTDFQEILDELHMITIKKSRNAILPRGRLCGH